MSAVLIAGIGSPHGADQLGWAVIEALREEKLAVPVRLMACRLPSQLCAPLLEAQRAIVVDAMLGEGDAGVIRVFDALDLPDAPAQISSHGSGLLEAVQLALALGMPPERLQVVVLNAGDAAADLEPLWVRSVTARVKAMLEA